MIIIKIRLLAPSKGVCNLEGMGGGGVGGGLFHDLGDDYLDVCFIIIRCAIHLFYVLFLMCNIA